MQTNSNNAPHNTRMQTLRVQPRPPLLTTRRLLSATCPQTPRTSLRSSILPTQSLPTVNNAPTLYPITETASPLNTKRVIACWTARRGVLDKHGRETPFEKSTRQGAGATLLHFTNPSLAPHLSPSPPKTRSLLTVHQKSLHSPPPPSAKRINGELLSTTTTLMLATLT